MPVLWIRRVLFGIALRNLVAECIHFTLLGIILPTVKLKVYTFGGL